MEIGFDNKMNFLNTIIIDENIINLTGNIDQLFQIDSLIFILTYLIRGVLL